MDLTSTEWDSLNDLRLNPDWYGQPSGHGSSLVPDIDANAACDYFRNPGGTLHTEMCSTQHLNVDERRPYHGIVPDLVGWICHFGHAAPERLHVDAVYGHINWEVVTYTGTLFFDDYQDPKISFRHVIPEDGDLDFTLVRADHGGYVKESAEQDHGGITLEANRFELGDLDTPWWSEFRDLFERGAPFDRAREKLDGVHATVIGLLGIDTKHGAHTELHPVFAMLARTSADGETPQHWVFLARNWGYEGGCSRDEHFLIDQHLVKRDVVSFAIAAPPSATLQNLAVSPRAAAGWISPQPGGPGHVLTVRFPKIAKPSVVGEFDMCDRPCPPRAPPEVPRTGASAANHSEADVERRPEEARLDPLLALLTAKQQRMFATALRNESGGDGELYRAFETAAGGPQQAHTLLRRFAAHKGGSIR
jgi:hypothetical protein